MKREKKAVDPVEDFVKEGLLGERVYAPEEDEEEEEAGDDTVPYDKAKIDQDLPQAVPGDVAKKAGVNLGDADQPAVGPDEEYPPKDPAMVDGEEPPAEGATDDSEGVVDDSEGGDETEEPVDGEEEPTVDDEEEVVEGGDALPQIGISVFAEGLCRMLGSAKHFAEAMKTHEHQFVEAYGAERLPVLNEIVHKLTTAEEMLGGCIAPPDAAPASEEGDDGEEAPVDEDDDVEADPAAAPAPVEDGEEEGE